VGKIAISESDSLKPGKLTDEEYATMQTTRRRLALRCCPMDVEVVQMAECIAGSNHERWDGKAIRSDWRKSIYHWSVGFCVADVFDALTHARPYKKAGR